MKQQLLEEAVTDMLRVLEGIKVLSGDRHESKELTDLQLKIINSDADNTIYNIKQRLGIE